MGSCISSSSSKEQQQQPEDSSDMKFGLPFVSKTHNHLIIPSPVKHKSLSLPVTGMINDHLIFFSYILLCVALCASIYSFDSFIYCFLLSCVFPTLFYRVQNVLSSSLLLLLVRHVRSF